MQDPRAFMTIERAEPPREPAARRLRHWREYTRLAEPDRVTRQAQRCMDCGVPCCHQYCPVHNLVPDWNGLLVDGHWRQAWQQLESTNNFPEFTGRLCPAPCESACTLMLEGAPVTIRNIELAIVERAWREGWVRPKPARRKRRERVAVVGSGPAGLACAQSLARAGYRVSVYEKADRAGGLLRYGIPDFRLEKSVLERRLAQIEAEGVAFHVGVRVGDRLALDALRGEVDAVVLACGASSPRRLEVPGSGLDGIHYAMRYLEQQNRVVAGEHIDPRRRIDARGLDVVIIGGGDTGQDCAGTALRQGARSVTQVQYHERPPERVDIRRYWPEPAPLLRPSDVEEEGCRRLWGYDTVAFEGREGHVEAVRLQPLRWYRNSEGCLVKQAADASSRRLEAQLVLIAIGFAHTEHDTLVTRAGLSLDARGNVRADDSDYRTSLDGIFSCGDMRRGQSLVVWAIREGRQCARAVDMYLAGDSELPAV